MHEGGPVLVTGVRPQAIFLDRDGTLNRERADYVKCWQEYEWLPGARAALALLAQLGVPILIITNQSAVNRGILGADVLAAMHDRVRGEAEVAGGRIDDFLICPHAPAEQCGCRKPRPGLLHQAAEQYGLELARCVFIGDAVTDLQASAATGCPCILVRTGRQGPHLDELVAALEGKLAATPIVDDLQAAASQLIAAAQVQLDAI